MKSVCLFFLVILMIPGWAHAGEVIPVLQRAMSQSDAPTLGVWVKFHDKGIAQQDLAAALATEEALLSPKTLIRRSRVLDAGQPAVDARDLPLSVQYLTGVAATGAQPRRISRWFNAGSFNATHEQILEISNLPYVQSVDLVAQFRRSSPPVFSDREYELPESDKNAAADRWNLNYGASITAAELINLPPVHDAGLTGEGIVVAVLDAGFSLSHESLQNVPILAQWDFVHDDDSVEWQPGDHEWQNHHGSQVLSTIMAFSEGNLIGTAYGASTILAMTEDTGDETPIEEDNWVAAVEWVESLGADLVTTSLGYYYWYDFSDLDGNTALITRAADMAVGRGMSVFTSAGNERNTAEWGHLTAPADGDSVVAVGAVDFSGTVASFSSPGPTYDGRIKPDVAALGVGNRVAAYFDDHSFMSVSGTSFSAPQVAGVATLMLERIPTLTPMQIREALREGASQSRDPDNDLGWGIIDAVAALSYWGPTITHQPLPHTEDTVGPYEVVTTITDRASLDNSTLFLYWRLDDGLWQREVLTAQGEDQFTGYIPGAGMGGQIDYYLEAGDENNYVITTPHNGSTNPWSFEVGVDNTAPDLFHMALNDQTLGIWPPVLTAEATDEQGMDRVELEFSLNGGAVQGPVLFRQEGPIWELQFPLAPDQISTGDIISYEVRAIDIAGNPNVSISGPHEVRIVDNLGLVLIIDDLESSMDKDASRNLTADFDQWLTEAGYVAEVVDSDLVNGAHLQEADAVFLTCGNNYYPVGSSLLRANLIHFAEGGGKILIEGGELAATCFYEDQYIEFAHSVLRSSEFFGDFVGPMIAAPGHERHAFRTRPNLLPDIMEQDMSPNPNDYGASDVVTPDEHSLLVMPSIYNNSIGGVLLHDNNTGPEAGQIVFMSIDLGYMPENLARPLLENSLAYLLSREAPGNSSLSGTITLAGSADASGVVVQVDDEHSVVTGPSGYFLLDGLHGSTYSITAAIEGYGTGSLTVELAADENLSGLQMVLSPAVYVQLTDAPEMAIPDNNPDGLIREIQVLQPGLVQAINIDINISHSSIGNLVISLTSPSGTTVRLHDNTGGLADDLVGNWPANLIVDGPGNLADFLDESAQGTWQMKVADTGWGATGTWHTWGLNLGVIDAISGVDDGLPSVTRVLGNMPNPFNPRTTVMFDLAREGVAQIAIYNVRGQMVRSLGADVLAAGRHEVVWDGMDSAGRGVGSGVYFFRLKTNGESLVSKMTLVR